MSVSAVSNINPVYGQQQAQAPAPPSKSQASPQQPPDTVTLSPAAAAHMSGADGDGH